VNPSDAEGVAPNVAGSAESPERSQPTVVKAAAKKEKPSEKKKPSGEQGKRNTAERPAGEAVRPRRAG